MLFGFAPYSALQTLGHAVGFANRGGVLAAALTPCISLVPYVALQNNGPSVGFAIGGGILLMAGNLSVQYALAFVGLAVAETTTSSMTVVCG